MSSNRQAYRYQRQALLADYARATAGIGICLGFAGLGGPKAVTFWPLIGFSVIFAAFGLHASVRHRSEIVLSDQGIARKIDVPLPGTLLALLGQTELAWHEIDGARLRFFGGRKASIGGILEMRLTGARTKICFDGALEQFDRVARHCAFKAKGNGVSLDAATENNLAALGLG